jgi:hypothetical protein
MCVIEDQMRVEDGICQRSRRDLVLHGGTGDRPFVIRRQIDPKICAPDVSPGNLLLSAIRELEEFSLTGCSFFLQDARAGGDAKAVIGSK